MKKVTKLGIILSGLFVFTSPVVAQDGKGGVKHAHTAIYVDKSTGKIYPEPKVEISKKEAVVVEVARKALEYRALSDDYLKCFVAFSRLSYDKKIPNIKDDNQDGRLKIDELVGACMTKLYRYEKGILFDYEKTVTLHNMSNKGYVIK